MAKVSKPDPKLVKDQLATLQGLLALWGTSLFMSYFIWIQTKRDAAISAKNNQKLNTRLVPFVPNPIQNSIEKKLGQYNICLKPRQIGLTTWFLLRRIFVPAITETGINNYLISQSNDKATEHFAMVTRALQFVGATSVQDFEQNDLTVALRQNLLHTKYSNRKEIIFDQIGNTIRIGSAEVEEAGQGSCLAPKSWVIKADYTVDYLKNIKVGDWLLDEYGEQVQVSKTFVIPAEKQPYKGKAIAFNLALRGAIANIKAAPNHPFLTQRGEIEAQELTEEDFIAYPKKELTDKLKFIDFQKNYGSKKYTTTSRIHQCVGNDTIKLDRNFGVTCGYYLGDGVGSSNRRISFIVVAPRKKKVVLPKIKAFLKVNNLGKLNKATKKGKKSLGLNNAAFARFIKQNFGYAKDKHVAEWWADAPKEFLRGLLEGWLYADGYFPGKYAKSKCPGKVCRLIQGYGKNARIVFAMREIAIALGVGMPGLTIRDKKDSRIVIMGRECNNKGRRYVLNFSDQSFEGMQQVFPWIRKIGITQGRKTGKQYQDNKYVYIKIRKLRNTKIKEFRDLTVKSKRHLYCLVQGITHNTLTHVVASEVARWPGKPEETLANLKEAITLEGTLDLESTANGAGGYFFEEYFRAVRGESEFTAHFSPWWEQPEYRLELTEEQAAEMAADLAEDEQRLIATYKLDLEQIAFRRAKKLSLRHNFDEKYAEDDLTCFIVFGEGFFDRDVLRARMQEIVASSPAIESRGGGALRIFRRPIKGHTYVIGADPASGRQITSDSSDYSAASVLDVETGEQVASFLAKLSPEEFAFDLIQLALNYNNALLGVERGTAADSGGDGGTVLLTCRNEGYTNVYRHKEVLKGRARKIKGISSEVIAEPGIPMSGRVRPIALNKAKYVIANEPELINDIDLVRQCLVFVRNEKGRPEASAGNHDDAVMAFAIAHLVRQFVLGGYDPLSGRKERYGDTPSEYAEDEEDE